MADADAATATLMDEWAASREESTDGATCHSVMIYAHENIVLCHTLAAVARAVAPFLATVRELVLAATVDSDAFCSLSDKIGPGRKITIHERPEWMRFASFAALSRWKHVIIYASLPTHITVADIASVIDKMERGATGDVCLPPGIADAVVDAAVERGVTLHAASPASAELTRSVVARLLRDRDDRAWTAVLPHRDTWSAARLTWMSIVAEAVADVRRVRVVEAVARYLPVHHIPEQIAATDCAGLDGVLFPCNRR